MIRKTCVFILIALLMSSAIRSQSAASEGLIALLMNQKTIADSVVNFFGIRGDSALWVFNEKRYIEVDSYFKREIELGLTLYQLRYYDLKAGIFYDLTLGERENEIIFTRLSRREEKRSTEVISHSTSEFEHFLSNYNGLTGQELRLKDLDEEYFSLNEFGLACSIGGTPSEYTIRMMKMVRNRQVRKLRSWLNSLNINHRLFGAVGLKWLEFGGVELRKDDLTKIHQLILSDYLINYCSGCSPEMSTIRELVGTSWFREEYNIYKEMGWFD